MSPDQSDNLIEYVDPVVYDLENATFEPDGLFYLSLAKEAQGPLLELGCGTGRITIPLAREGLEITALEITPQMLTRAEEKAAGFSNLAIQWVLGDARTFQLDRQYRLIYEPGAVFQHVHARADHEAILRQVRAHLLPGGRFVLSLIFPSLDLLADEEEHEVWTYPHPAGYTMHVSFSGHYDRVRQIKTETAVRRWTGADGQAHEVKAPLALRYFFPLELEALLHYNGFKVLESYGDFDRSPLEQDSQQLIYVCGLSSPHGP